MQMAVTDRSRATLLWIGTALVLAYPTAASACEASDFQMPMQIIQAIRNDAMKLGYQCGMSANPVACIVQGLQAVTDHYTPLIQASAATVVLRFHQ